MIKEFNVNLNEREINTILYTLSSLSESTQEWTLYNNKYEYSLSLIEKLEEIIKG